MKFVDPKNDVAFRKIFGNENKKEILISFLNAVLDLEGDRKIKEVTILNPFQAPRIKELKETVLDVRAKDHRDISFIVEMQVEEKPAFIKRVQYYSAKAYSSQIERGEEYPKLNQVIFIGIVNFDMFEGDGYLTRHLIMNTSTNKQELKDLEFNFIELKKFDKKESELSSIIEKWTCFFKNAGNATIIPVNLKDEGLKEAYEEANKFNWTKEELDAYDYAGMIAQDRRGAMELATQKAMKKGLEQGLEQGLEEGERKKAFEIAEKLLDALDVEIIAEKTGLSIEEINQLKK